MLGSTTSTPCIAYRMVDISHAFQKSRHQMHINCYERFVRKDEQPTVPSVGETLASFGGWNGFWSKSPPTRW